ncbi:4-hydroxy-3-methylbut-2-en-1-yl diphosphate synthase [Thermodesulfobium narugense DSM 14796]|uniref:4-hydroxy-3-methylbut-2-en-1-yl diphosphate synthase (flavodoxin) n=1 Tax=Thermodesulfobium narugense DSM 14796 TaxID=747365 RepID=M1E5M4_9BACT|nr:flavodoxin-dependent (E)-4-hydroxy-3-methylbut-2-enyl-diphosphate synthase [Thermodesulfobium narugense]AEE14351.1 4-hydroxy-3-methylbut-2-en-1-yl diphosphate synthase [Thermodesulfobium narugense DSM 14796]
MIRQKVAVKDLIFGSGKVFVQTMTKTDTRNVNATVEQIRQIQKAGADLVRLAVPDNEAAESIYKIVKRVSIPLVADVHFDYRLALKAIDAGISKIRINPGNIGSKNNLLEVVKAASSNNIPIRIGVNEGSIPKDLLGKFQDNPVDALVSSVEREVSLLENVGFNNIVISAKTFSVNLLLKTYELLFEKFPYPLHVGVTEAGPLFQGTVRSSVAIGILLNKGIGDTIRVSLSSSPIDEIRVGKEILKSLELETGPVIISCPTCGRTEVNLRKLTKVVEKRLLNVKKPLKIAIMGCAVNGPSEAKSADLGIACAKQFAFLFKYGKIIKKIDNDNLEKIFLDELESLIFQEDL